MRKILVFPLLILFVLSLPACLKDKVTRTYTVLEPVYRDKAAVLADIKSSTPVALSNPGKIYLYGSYIFLNEVNKGVHIIDNTDPSSPRLKAFIHIPGNVDIAVKGSVLYADLFTDMVAIDISNPLNVVLKKVVPKVFPERQYAAGFIADTNKVIVDWIQRTITETVDAPPRIRNWIPFNILASGDAGGPAGFSGPNKVFTGIAGSMSRFVIMDDYLYAVNNHSLRVMDISAPADPVMRNTVEAGWNIETIYPFRDKLFLGSSTGMFIYSVGNPLQPVREGMFMHARACDPVVADDYYAYVTLRAGTFCQGTNNQLDIIDVRNIQQPRLVKTYGFTNPYGLAKDGNLLFICDGSDGLKVYNASDVQNLQLLDRKKMDAFDVIAWNSRLLVVAKGGLYQYSYANPASLALLSKILVTK